jgi:hyaluronoglucosaminidase
VRGVVEGFYGEPWSHASRLDAFSFLGARGMNAYVYAPKDDAKHRARWRDPYDADEYARFVELIAHAHAHGIDFGFAISPGLDIDYASTADRETLRAKLRPFVDAGARWFLLLVDDIPMAPGLAARQCDLATWLLDALRELDGGVRLTVCPTEYVGTRRSEYLATLGADLPADVDVMWTGPTVCSPEISASSARAWAEALGGRKPLVWDNYPVNDGTMAASLHLGPYRGRDAALADETVGILCNPMNQAHASLVALATAADFLSDPDGYDEQASWRRAIDAVGGDRRAPLRVLAESCADGPLCEPADLDLAVKVNALDDEIDGPGWCDALRNVAEVLKAAKSLHDDFPLDAGDGGDDHDDGLVREVAPWAAAAALEAAAGIAALRLLQQLRPVVSATGGAGRVAPVDAEAAMHAAFFVMYAWSGARRNEKVVFGPRFALYPAVVQLPDGAPGLDVHSAVREDANAIDALCRLALADYEAWRAGRDAAEGGAATLRVFVDGEERVIDTHGCFDARGEMVLARDERCATRVGPGTLLPFRDPRLS